MNTDHVSKFNSRAHRNTVEEMRKRREEVHSKGEEVYRRTGSMDSLVSIKGCVTRRSKFAFAPNTDGLPTLVNGPKIPYLFATDGTGSFGRNIGKAFEAAPMIYSMLDSNAHDHQMDFSFGVFQDRDDHHDTIQIPQFESDNRFAEHMRLLVPDRAGGDAPEDYDVGIWYAANKIEADLFRYGGKGYFVLLLDAPGRGQVERRLLQRATGCEIPSNLSTREVFQQQLLANWHGFVVVFEGHSNWWKDITGPGRTVEAHSSRFFVEYQAGLVHVTEIENPSVESLYDFYRAGQGSTISRAETRRIFEAYQRAGVPFGENVRLNVELPKKGDVFAQMSDLWPIGHPRVNENPAPGLPDPNENDNESDDSPPTEIDWSRF